MDKATRDILNNAVERSAYDPAFFLRFFLPHWFPSEIPAFHMGMIAIRTKKVAFLNSYPQHHEFLCSHFRYEPDPNDHTDPGMPVFYLGEDGKMRMRLRDNINIVVPRGFSKTTLNKGLSIYDAATDKSLFLVFISETASHSETQVNDIKVEFEANENLRLAYGDQVPTKSESEKWTSKELQLRNGAIIMSRGRGGQVRGMTFQGRRPNKIILDDVEDDESVTTKEQRNKTKNWFYAAVVPAGQLMEGAKDEDWAQDDLQVINLGTLLSAECLVQTLASDTEFGTIRFGAVVEEETRTMLWPYKMGWDLYQKMRERYRRVGALDKFTREYDSAIRVSEDALFPAIFIYQPTLRSDLVNVALAGDPALSEKSEADFAAMIVSGRRASDGALWLMDEWADKGIGPTEFLDKFFELQKLHDADKTGIEAVAYQASLIHLARERMAEEQRFFECVPIRHGNKVAKDSRITGMLSPRYKAGYLRHLKPLPLLEGNLADWPNGKKDVADAAAMSLGLLGETTALRMEGLLEDAEPLPEIPLPEALMRSGNYLLKSTQHRASQSSRYGI